METEPNIIDFIFNDIFFAKIPANKEHQTEIHAGTDIDSNCVT